MKIVIGSDKSGFLLKEAIKRYLIEENIEFDDLGTQNMDNGQPYYEVSNKIAPLIQKGVYDKGILVCGTGMGMSVVSNKYKGIYAACVESVYTAKMSRAINDANILCLGGWLNGEIKAVEMVKVFIETKFLEGLEDWRQEFLSNAKKQVNIIEEKIYDK